MRKLQRGTCAVPDAPKPPSFRKMISTGSTLLDLAISSNKSPHGGLPGGIIVEIFGPTGTGKTALLASIAASAQARGGAVKFLDPESRLDKEYCRIYGVKLSAKDYDRPDLVSEMFDRIITWEPRSRKGAINVIAADSLAALSTEMEMESEDKMGMKRAKEFSEGLRKTARLIANNKWLIVASNQERMTPKGTTTPGGKAIPYYSSLRIRIAAGFPKSKIYRERAIGSKKVKLPVGIISEATIVKSSIDVPYRYAPIYIIFGYGIDDIRANLQWLKEVRGTKGYEFGRKKFGPIERAIEYIERNNLESEIREMVVEAWGEVAKKFNTTRKPKEII